MVNEACICFFRSMNITWVWIVTQNYCLPIKWCMSIQVPDHINIEKLIYMTCHMNQYIQLLSQLSFQSWKQYFHYVLHFLNLHISIGWIGSTLRERQRGKISMPTTYQKTMFILVGKDSQENIPGPYTHDISSMLLRWLMIQLLNNWLQKVPVLDIY